MPSMPGPALPPSRPAMPRDALPFRPARGLTLVELMIAMVILAVLVAFAYPSYADQVRRGQVQEAFTVLSDHQIKLEQYYQDWRNYGGTACADAAGTPAWASFPDSAAQRFVLSCSLGAGGQAYTLQASGRGGSAAAGHVYSVDQDRQRRTTRFRGAAVDKGCWLWRGDEC